MGELQKRAALIRSSQEREMEEKLIKKKILGFNELFKKV